MAVERADSIADIIRQLGLSVHAGNYRTVKRHIARMDLDTAHMTDGNSLNDQIENLCWLCPNCHSQTENYAGRNFGRKEVQDV